jgi:hypothetical protein
MQWPMLVLGGGLVALSAILKLSGGATDFHAYAAPFWLFIAGLASLFTGGWYRDKERAAVGMERRDFVATSLTSGLAGHGLVPAGHAAVAPAMHPALSGGLNSGLNGGLNGALHGGSQAVPHEALSSLQRPATKQAGMYATSVGQLSEANVIERIRSLENENERLRAFLGEANTSISRAERRHAPL